MANPEEAGTPQNSTSGSGASTGTSVGAADGSGSAGEPNVEAGLLKAWKEKVEAANRVIAENEAHKARIADLEARIFQPAQPVNPMAQMVQTLQEEAAWNPSAAASLQALSIAAAQQQETLLTTALIRQKCPDDLWDDVQGLVRASGYRMSVPEAIQRARGKEVPVLHEQLSAKDDEIRKLREQLDARTVGSGGGKTTLSMTPAAVVDNGANEMDADEYAAIMQRGGAEAIALRDRGVKIRR